MAQFHCWSRGVFGSFRIEQVLLVVALLALGPRGLLERAVHVFARGHVDGLAPQQLLYGEQLQLRGSSGMRCSGVRMFSYGPPTVRSAMISPGWCERAIFAMRAIWMSCRGGRT